MGVQQNYDNPLDQEPHSLGEIRRALEGQGTLNAQLIAGVQGLQRMTGDNDGSIQVQWCDGTPILILGPPKSAAKPSYVVKLTKRQAQSGGPLTVTLAGTTNNTCTTCSGFNGTFELLYQGQAGGVTTWETAEPSPCATGASGSSNCGGCENCDTTGTITIAGMPALYGCSAFNGTWPMTSAPGECFWRTTAVSPLDSTKPLAQVTLDAGANLWEALIFAGSGGYVSYHLPTSSFVCTETNELNLFAIVISDNLCPWPATVGFACGTPGTTSPQVLAVLTYDTAAGTWLLKISCDPQSKASAEYTFSGTFVLGGDNTFTFLKGDTSCHWPLTAVVHSSAGATLDTQTSGPWQGVIQVEKNGAIVDGPFLCDPNTYCLYPTRFSTHDQGNPEVGDRVVAIPDKYIDGVWEFVPKPKTVDQGECHGCGWLADIPTSTCLKIRMINGFGRCDCITSDDGWTAAFMGGDTGWIGGYGWVATGMSNTCCGCSVAVFRLGANPTAATLTLYGLHTACPPPGSPGADPATLPVLNLNLQWVCCDRAPGTDDAPGPLRAIFVGSGTDACDGTPAACENVFYLSVECSEPCPEPVCECCCPAQIEGVLQFTPAPRFWGFGPIFWFNDTRFNGCWTMAHVEDDPTTQCKWEGICSITGDTAILEYVDVPGAPVFRLTIGGAKFEKDATAWDCCKGNTLDYVSGGSVNSDVAKITVIPIITKDSSCGTCDKIPPATLTVSFIAPSCPVLDGFSTVVTYDLGTDQWYWQAAGPDTTQRVYSVAVKCGPGGKWQCTVGGICTDPPSPANTPFGVTTTDSPTTLHHNPLEIIWTGETVTADVPAAGCCVTGGSLTIHVTE